MNRRILPPPTAAELDAARPRPLRAAARQHATVPAAAGLLLSALLLTGVISRGVFDVLSYALAAAAILAGGLSTWLAVYRTVRAGEQQVTPTSDPRDAHGVPLIARTDALLGDVLERLAELVLTGPPPPAAPSDITRPDPRPGAARPHTGRVRPPRNAAALLAAPDQLPGDEVPDDPAWPRDPALAGVDDPLRPVRRRAHRYRDDPGGADGPR